MAPEASSFSSHPRFSKSLQNSPAQSPDRWIPSLSFWPFPSLKETEWRTAGGSIHRLLSALTPAGFCNDNRACIAHMVHSGGAWEGVWEACGRQQGRGQGQRWAAAETGLGGGSPGFGEDYEHWSDKAAERHQEEGWLQGQERTSAVAGKSGQTEVTVSRDGGGGTQRLWTWRRGESTDIFSR